MSASSIPPILSLRDTLNLSYLSFNPLSIPSERNRPLNIANLPNSCTFLSEDIQISRVATGIFSTDLTSRDDVLLAVSSILLIFVLEAILTTLLLRSQDSHISTLGFSIKHFLELARGFRFPSHIFSGKKKSYRHSLSRKFNKRVLLLALFVLFASFALEVVILVLSSPSLVDVYNTDTAFTLLDVVQPEWNQVRDNVGAAVHRPCTAITMVGVEQEQHMISPCLTVNGTSTLFASFDVVDDNVDMIITSNVHENGADHFITIAQDSLAYLSRCYFRLGDSRNRIMVQRVRIYNAERRFFFLHKQIVAFLFNAYVRETNDDRMNLARLSNLTFNHSTQAGPNVEIIQINNRDRFRTVTSTQYRTILKGVLPRGKAALQFTQAILKGATGIQLAGPDHYDVIMGSGNEAGNKALMWRESQRSLNWLSLNIALIASLTVFIMLRILLRPVATAEIAELYIRDAVGAKRGRPTLCMEKEEKRWFKLVDVEVEDAFKCEEYSDVSSDAPVESRDDFKTDP